MLALFKPPRGLAVLLGGESLICSGYYPLIVSAREIPCACTGAGDEGCASDGGGGGGADAMAA